MPSVIWKRSKELLPSSLALKTVNYSLNSLPLINIVPLPLRSQTRATALFLRPVPLAIGAFFTVFFAADGRGLVEVVAVFAVEAIVMSTKPFF